MAQELVEMAKDLVMAMIRSNQVSPDDMQKELQNTYASLLTLQAQEAGGATSVGVANSGPVNWRSSIKKHSVSCLVCGETFKQLSSKHLRSHDLDPKSYRQQFGIPMTQPLSAKATTAARRAVVQNIRPWEKAPTFKKSQGADKPSAPKRAARKKAAARV